MPEEKKYAIRCSTEEQAREHCIGSGYKWFYDYENDMEEYYKKKGYTIINYDEAISLGLLGEKYNQDLVDATKYAVDMAMEGTESYSLDPVNVCKSCLGKKQNSVYKGDKVLQPDFIGDGRYLLEGEGITMVDCSRCHGTGLEPEYIPEVDEPVKYEQVCKDKGGHEIYSKGDDSCFCRQCGKKGTRDELRLDFNAEPVKESPSELDTRDFDLCDIFNKTKTKSDLYLGIIDYLVDKGFLQDKGRKAKESPSDNWQSEFDYILSQLDYYKQDNIKNRLMNLLIMFHKSKRDIEMYNESPSEDNLVEKVNQSLLLQFLRQNTELYENNKEQEFIELLSEFIKHLSSK